MNTVFIYILRDPGTHEVRYVGKSNRPNHRLSCHLEEAKNQTKFKSHKLNWLRLLLIQNNSPTLEIIDEVPIEHWQQWEVAWIEFYKEQGCNLVNGTLGGDGVVATPEVKKKIGDANRGSKSYWFGKKFSLDRCAKIAAGNRGKKMSLDSLSKKRKRKNCSSRFKGISWCSNRKLWSAEISLFGSRHRLGRYESEEDAAHVYDYAAKIYFGSSAYLNFPENLKL